MDQLFSTLAYQLAINTTGIRQHIEQAIVEDPALPMKSASTQLQKLVIDPVKLLSTTSPSPILIIEGLNECEEEGFQDAFLGLIAKILLDPTVRIRFIISGISDHEQESTDMCRNHLVLGWLILDRQVDTNKHLLRSARSVAQLSFFVFLFLFFFVFVFV